MQETRVHHLTPAAGRDLHLRLQEALAGEDASWRPASHAVFSVRTPAWTATLYRSGKLVLQGRELDAFALRFLEGQPAAAPPPLPEGLSFQEEMVGCDESGKGDFFGPLVVAALVASPEQVEELRRIGAADSKQVSDAGVRRVAAVLAQRFDHEVLAMDPEEYNRTWEKDRNVNVLLARLHAKAAAALLRRHPSCRVMLVDRFAEPRVLEKAAAEAGIRGITLRQVAGGERNPVVAAASILARERFLDGLARCEEECGSDLHKGAGAPVDRAARRVLAIGGKGLLAKVAKVHFKNTRKAGGLIP